MAWPQRVRHRPARGTERQKGSYSVLKETRAEGAGLRAGAQADDQVAEKAGVASTWVVFILERKYPSLTG